MRQKHDMMQATIDRIDEGTAVLITCEKTPARLIIPATLLPQGSREGDVVIITVVPDREATEAARGRVKRTIDRLMDQGETGQR